uniref:Uncharacterized protein n=1 Tax=Tetranychus urticae TaxID=32264 RepID=T1KIH1_TETUR
MCVCLSTSNVAASCQQYHEVDDQHKFDVYLGGRFPLFSTSLIGDDSK